jgi:hypothetical protein
VNKFGHKSQYLFRNILISKTEIYNSCSSRASLSLSLSLSLIPISGISALALSVSASDSHGFSLPPSLQLLDLSQLFAEKHIRKEEET